MRRLWGALAFIALIVRFSLAQGVSPTPPADGSDQPIQPIDPDGGEPAGSASGPATGSAATGSAATGSASMGSGSPITPATAPSPAAERAVTVDDVVVDASRLRFGILLFGDVSARLQAPAKPSSHFSIGAVGMRLNANLGSNVDALGEIAFEAGRVDVEQLVLNYRTPRWVFSLGRLHTELGYWNTAYHHGFWLQPLIARPHPIRFEDDGGLVPVHWVGAHLMHRIPVDSGEVILVGGVGNGRGKIVDDILIDGDVNQAKGFLLKLAYRRHGEHRIDVGTTAIIDRIPPADAMIRPARPDKSIDELIVAAHLFYRGPVLTVHAEAFGFFHSADTRHTTTTVFAVAGYRAAESLTAYGGIDLVVLDETDPFFVPDPAMPALADVTELILGARYDLGTWDALKFEGHADLHSGAKTQYTLTANWSFGI